MKKMLLLLSVVVALGMVACGDDDAGTTAEERCCACVRDHDCGGPQFTFGACVPDGYYGTVDLGVDATCLGDHCADECDGAQFL